MNTPHKAALFLIYFLVISFQSVFSQTEDVGIILERNPTIQITDSLFYLMHSGATRIFNDPIEGGAIEFYGGYADSVDFRIFENYNWTTWLSGKLFYDKFSEKGIATFLLDLKKGEKIIQYRLFSQDTLTITKISTFIKYTEPSITFKQPIIPVDYEIPKPRIISREEWGAAPPNGNYSNHPYFDKLTVHHAACCGAENLEEGKEAVRGIQDFHQNGRGWIDIGYHFLVDRAGNIYQGRPETVIGAHVGGANTGNIGVCLLGCYHPPEENCEQLMTTTSRDSIVKLFAWISQTYGQNANVLLGHRDYFGTTSCPGDNVWPHIPDIRLEIIDLHDTGGIPLINFQYSAYPNPFFRELTFQYDLNTKSTISINIYDLLGRKVKTIADNEYGPGKRYFTWNGKNFMGEKLSSGVYLIRTEFNGKIENKKVILIKR